MPSQPADSLPSVSAQPRSTLWGKVLARCPSVTMPSLRTVQERMTRIRKGSRPSMSSTSSASAHSSVSFVGRASLFARKMSSPPPPQPYWSPSLMALEGSSDLSDYELLNVLGRGTFGVVRLGRHRATGHAVAVKIVDKEQILEMRQETNIFREQTVHLGLEHPFVSRLFTTFQDHRAVYFVLEYCPGGEVYSLVYHEDEDSMDDTEEEGREEEEAEEGSAKGQQGPAKVDAEEEEKNQATNEMNANGEEEEGEETRRRSGPEVEEEEQTMEEEKDDDTCPTESESEDDDLRPRAPRSEAALRRMSDATENRTAKLALLSGLGGIAEPHAAFYLACLANALEYLHARDVLYRDLKLENLVLDPQGYPKLIDFGLSKPDASRCERNTTMCGSMEYLAPELVQRVAYDHRADIWSFGILMYELLFGVTPFAHHNRREQGRRITEDEVTFPEDAEQKYPRACALIRRLLAKKPENRPDSFQQVRLDAFFRHYFATPRAWAQLASRQTRAPFVPRLCGAFDTSLFVTALDEEEENDDAFAAYNEVNV